jgi:hypothetical protein
VAHALLIWQDPVPDYVSKRIWLQAAYSRSRRNLASIKRDCPLHSADVISATLLPLLIHSASLQERQSAAARSQLLANQLRRCTTSGSNAQNMAIKGHTNALFGRPTRLSARSGMA